MRTMALLLALLTGLLALTPCWGIQDDCAEEALTECNAHHEGGEDHQPPEPPCSPFFTCGACLGFVAQPAPAFIQKESDRARSAPPTFYLDRLTASHPPPPRKPPRTA